MLCCPLELPWRSSRLWAKRVGDGSPRLSLNSCPGLLERSVYLGRAAQEGHEYEYKPTIGSSPWFVSKYPSLRHCEGRSDVSRSHNNMLTFNLLYLCPCPAAMLTSPPGGSIIRRRDAHITIVFGEGTMLALASVRNGGSAGEETSSDVVDIVW